MVKCMRVQVIYLVHTQKLKQITTVDFIEMQITPSQNSCKSHKLINILTSSSAFLLDNKPACILSPCFHFYTYLKVFILPDLCSVTLMHCLAPGEAIHNNKRQECAREKGLDCNVLKYLNTKASSCTSSILCHCVLKMRQTTNH